ncbi:hypothetical protein EsH8_IX_000860 [Colletotrichum jinshuiense]
MTENMDWARVLQLVNLMGVTHLAGYQFGTDKVAMHNIMELRDKETIVKHWFRGWDFGRKYGPAMVCGTSAVFGFLAWKDGLGSPALPYNLAASVLMIAVAPYTQFKVFPVNDQLLKEHERLGEEKKTDKEPESASYEAVREWAAEWKRLDLHRQGLAYVAALAGLTAVLKS